MRSDELLEGIRYFSSSINSIANQEWNAVENTFRKMHAGCELADVEQTISFTGNFFTNNTRLHLFAEDFEKNVLLGNTAILVHQRGRKGDFSSSTRFMKNRFVSNLELKAAVANCGKITGNIFTNNSHSKGEERMLYVRVDESVAFQSNVLVGNQNYSSVLDVHTCEQVNITSFFNMNIIVNEKSSYELVCQNCDANINASGNWWGSPDYSHIIKRLNASNAILFPILQESPNLFNYKSDVCPLGTTSIGNRSTCYFASCTNMDYETAELYCAWQTGAIVPFDKIDANVIGYLRALGFRKIWTTAATHNIGDCYIYDLTIAAVFTVSCQASVNPVACLTVEIRKSKFCIDKNFAGIFKLFKACRLKSFSISPY